MARAKVISLDEWGTKTAVDDPKDSWLEKPVSEWPDNVLFRVTDGTYARVVMNNGEAKVTFAVYNDGTMTKEDISETCWNAFKHDGSEPPQGHMARLDASVTLNMTETEEFHNLLDSDDGKPRETNYFLSEETAAPFKRGRILKKTGKVFKLGKASMYETGGGALRRYEVVSLGDRLQDLRKLSKAVFERLVWMDHHRQFAGSDQVKKAEAVKLFLKDRSENDVVSRVLAVVDQDPTKWGNKKETDWTALIKDAYRRVDRRAVIVDLLNEEKITEGISMLNVGEVREYVAKALASPEHVNTVAEALIMKGSVIADKRKSLVNKRKRKLPTEFTDKDV